MASSVEAAGLLTFFAAGLALGLGAGVEAACTTVLSFKSSSASAMSPVALPAFFSTISPVLEISKFSSVVEAFSAAALIVFSLGPVAEGVSRVGLAIVGNSDY